MKPKIKPIKGFTYLFGRGVRDRIKIFLEITSYKISSDYISVTIIPTTDYRRLLRDAKELADLKRRNHDHHQPGI